MDFHDADAPARLREWLDGPADGILSDMAANATGHRKTDHLRIVGLVELAADFAFEVLAPGGFFLAKVLQGGAEGELLARLKREFAAVRHVKPKASRADSAELYLLATGIQGAAGAGGLSRRAVLVARERFQGFGCQFLSLSAAWRKGERQSAPAIARRVLAPDVVGRRLLRPYHFPARNQSFQAFAAPFPGRPTVPSRIAGERLA